MIFKKVDSIDFYRNISFLFFIISFLVVGVNVIIAIILTIIALFFAFQYKCPICDKKLDIRHSTSWYKFCPKCGNRLE